MNLFSYLTESERDSYVSERMIEVENSIFFSSMRMIEEEYDANLLLAEVKVCRENGTDTDLTYLYEAATAQQEIDQRGPIKRIIDAIMKLIRSIKNKLFGAVDEEEGDDNDKLKLFENLKADGEQIKKIFDSFKNALTSALNGNGAQAWIELGQVGQEFAGLSVVSKIAAGAGAAGAAIFVKRKDLKRLRRYAISFTEFIEKNLGKLENKLNSLTTNSITESFLFLMEADNNSGNNQQPANGANQQQTNQTNAKGGQQNQQTTPPPKQTQNTGNNNNQNQNNTQQTTSNNNNNQKPAQNSNNGNNEPRQQNSASKFVGSIKQKAIKIAKEQLLPAIQSGIGKLRTFIQRCNYYLNISEARDRENQENREGIKADIHGSKANSTRDQLEDRKKELSKQVDDLNKSLKTADENERPKIEKKIRDLNKEISKIDNTIKKNTTDTDEERYQDHRAVQDHLSGTGGKKNENENNNNDEDQKDQTDEDDTNDSDQQTNSNKGQGQQENEKNSDKNVKNQNQNSNQRSKNDQNSTTQVNQTKKEISQEDKEKKKLTAERKKILDPKFKEIDENPQIDEDIYERLNDKGKELYAQIVDLRKGQEREKVFKNEDRLKEIEQNLKNARNELKNNVDKYTNPKQNSTNQTTQEKGEKGNDTSSKNSKNNSQKDPGRWSEYRDKAINYLTDNDIENFDRVINSLSGNSGFFVPYKKGKVGLSAKNLENNSTNIDFWNAVVKDFKENPSKKRADYLKKLAPTMFSDDAVEKRRDSKNKENLEKYTQSVNSKPQIDEDAFKRLTAEGKKEYNRANNLQIEQLKLRKEGKLSEANKMRRDAWDLLDKIENDTTGKYLKPSKSTAKQESFDWFDDEEEPFSSLFLFDD